MTLTERLQYHVSGAIARGEGEAIVEQHHGVPNGDVYIGVYNGLVIAALAHYDTPYYYAPRCMKRNQHTRSLATVKRRIDAYQAARPTVTEGA